MCWAEHPGCSGNLQLLPGRTGPWAARAHCHPTGLLQLCHPSLAQGSQGSRVLQSLGMNTAEFKAQHGNSELSP